MSQVTGVEGGMSRACRFLIMFVLFLDLDVGEVGDSADENLVNTHV